MIMLPCRNPRGTNFVCASRDHLLPALSKPTAFVASLRRNDKTQFCYRRVLQQYVKRSIAVGYAVWVAKGKTSLWTDLLRGRVKITLLARPLLLSVIGSLRFASLVSYSFISNLSKSFCLISSYALMKRSFVWLYIIIKSFMLHKSLAMYCFS